MTKEEKRLWYDFFKKIPITVNRQKVIGKYVVDFYIAKSCLVIELDGDQHYESEEQIISDFERDEFLKSQGIDVLRYSNIEIQQSFDAVCADILSHIEVAWDSIS